jgi:hypothetical protein
MEKQLAKVKAMERVQLHWWKEIPQVEAKVAVMKRALVLMTLVQKTKIL